MIKSNLNNFINQSINLFYTIMAFLPVVLFWADHYATIFLTIALVLAISIFFVPIDLYRFFQLSKSRIFYKNIGIEKFQKFTQQGEYAQQLIRYFDGNESFIYKRQRIKKLQNQIRIFESFHWACLIFFLLTCGNAIIKKEYIIATFILLSNIVYNVIPILIQQYNKTRIKGMLK